MCIINQENSQSSQNRSERSGQVTVSHKGQQYSSWTEQRAAKQFAWRTERNSGKVVSSTKPQCWHPWHPHAILSGFMGKQATALQCFQYENMLTWPGFQSLHLPSSPSNNSIPTLSFKTNTASLHQVYLCHCIFPGHVTVAATHWEGRTPEKATLQLSLLCSRTHILHPPLRAECTQELLPAHEPFSHLPQTPACAFCLQTFE